MDYAYSLSGAMTPRIFKVQANSTLSAAGIVVLAPTTGDAGVQTSTTTSFANAVGVTLDTATYVTAQQTDGTSAERLVSIIIDPHAVFRARMNGGATAGTALTAYDVTTATTDGLDITTGDAWNCPEYISGVAWGLSGANVGQHRKITGSDGTSATLTVAFDNDHQVGDTFARAPYWYFDDNANNVQTTSDLTQANTEIAVGTGGAAKIIDMELNGVDDSYVLFTLSDHTLGQTT